MSMANLLSKDTATLQRSTQTGDTSGGIVPSFASQVTGVNVRIQDASSSTQKMYAVDNIVVTHTVFTTESTGRKGDRWLTSDSRNLLVQGVRKRRGIGGIDTFYNYDCLEVRPGA